jgi:hypothetical protein
MDTFPSTAETTDILATIQADSHLTADQIVSLAKVTDLGPWSSRIQEIQLSSPAEPFNFQVESRIDDFVMWWTDTFKST